MDYQPLVDALRDLETLSRDGVEDTLWEVGMNFHNLSEAQRKQTLKHLHVQSDKLTGNDILNFVSYVLHSYFLQMDDAEKCILVDLVRERFDKGMDELGEGVELMAIMAKGCPDECRRKLVGMITGQVFDENSNPSGIISYTNAVRYVFDELDSGEQHTLYGSLLSIQQNTRYDFLKPSIQYTLDNIKPLMKS